MEAPEPLLPDPSASLWQFYGTIGLLLAVVAMTVVHAVRRQRTAWVIGMVVLPPVGIVVYWVAEAFRPKTSL